MLVNFAAVIKQFIHKISNIQIVKNLSVLVLGTLLAQLVVVAFQVVLRRLYSPSDFGAFAVYMSLVGILATISSLRYEQAIILPKEHYKSKSILQLSIFVNCLYSAMVFILFLVFTPYVIEWTSFPKEYSNWVLFIPVSIFILSTYQAVNNFLIREKLFKQSAENKIVRRFSEGIIQSLLGILKKSIGLFAGDIVGQLLITLKSIIQLRKHSIFTFSFNEITNVAKQYKSFPVKNALPSLMNAFSLLLPIIIVNKQFSEEITGYFDLARMVLIIPLSLITASLSQIILQQFSEHRNQNKSLKKSALSIFISLLVVSVLFVVVIKVFGVYLFSSIFGSVWEESGVYAALLVWAFALKFVVSPFNMVFTAFEKIGRFSLWQMFYFCCILYLYLSKFNSIEAFLKSYVMIEILSYSIVGCADLYLIYKYERKLKIN